MPGIITSEDARYALDIVKAICTQVGPGLPGSSQERERAALIKKELEAYLGGGNVLVEEFTLAPGAFLGVLPMSALLTLLAALLNIFTGHFTGAITLLTASAALAFSILALIRILYHRADPIPRIIHYARNEFHPNGGHGHWRCWHRSHWNAGMGDAGLSDRACDYHWVVLYLSLEMVN
jgi:hypothetical protein